MGNSCATDRGAGHAASGAGEPAISAWAAAAERRWRADAPPPLPIIAHGTPRDLSALLTHHYRGGPPATCELILRATDAPSGELAGVLVVSRPTLNGVGGARERAWPGVFRRDCSREQSAAAVNRSLRTISRVIVDPRFRAMGVARALVAAYLRSPLTTCTEAIAAMGRLSPFFVAAGMREVEARTSGRDADLALALRRARVVPCWFADAARARRLLSRPPVRAAFERWRRRGRTSVPAGAEELAAFAAARVVAPPRVFVYP